MIIILCSDLCSGCRENTSLSCAGLRGLRHKDAARGSCQEGSRNPEPREEPREGPTGSGHLSEEAGFAGWMPVSPGRKGSCCRCPVITSEVLLRGWNCRDKEGLAKYGYGGPRRASSPGGGTSQVGRGDAHAFGSLGLDRCRGCQGFRLFQEQTESLGCYKVFLAGIVRRPRRKGVCPTLFPLQGVCVLLPSRQILLSLAEGGTFSAEL